VWVLREQKRSGPRSRSIQIAADRGREKGGKKGGHSRLAGRTVCAYMGTQGEGGGLDRVVFTAPIVPSGGGRKGEEGKGGESLGVYVRLSRNTHL